MHAPSRIMVRMNCCWHFVSCFTINSDSRDCCMHIRPQTASVTRDRPKNASWCRRPRLPKFLFMCSTSMLMLDLSCLNTFLHRHVLSACPFYPSQLVLRLPCYISVQWYVVHTKTNLFSTAAHWPEPLHMSLSEHCFFFGVSPLSLKNYQNIASQEKNHKLLFWH